MRTTLKYLVAETTGREKVKMRTVSTRSIAMISIAVLLSGCAGQRALVAGTKHAEAYAKIGAVVGETVALSDDAGRREMLASDLQLVPKDAAIKAAIAIACAERTGPGTKTAFAAKNLAEYQAAVEALSKAPEDTVAGYISGLKKSLPSSAEVMAARETLQEAETKRINDCRAFANASVNEIAPAGVAPGDKVTAVFAILKKLLGVIEGQRRAEAYMALVVALDTPIKENIDSLSKEVRVLLRQVSGEALRSAAFSLESGRAQGSASARGETPEQVLRALGRFDRALAIQNGLYPGSDADGAFTKLRQGHEKIVAQVQAGESLGPESIDDLLAVLALVKSIDENLEKL